MQLQDHARDAVRAQACAQAALPVYTDELDLDSNGEI